MYLINAKINVCNDVPTDIMFSDKLFVFPQETHTSEYSFMD